MTTAVFDDTLCRAPNGYATPAVRPSLEAAKAWCHRLAVTHYENFHVASFFVPRALKPHFDSVYAFCRTSDDLGDEAGSVEVATELLAAWRQMLHQCFEEPASSRHPVFVALRPTIDACDLPLQPFDDLISAFELDQRYTHHASLATLEDYSRCSANPVGRLVLMMAGYRDEARMLLSDEICTGLQLANFWQDIVPDQAKGRRYIPEDAMERFGVSDEQLLARRFDNNIQGMMQFLVNDTRQRLLRGRPLVASVHRELATVLDLFVKGGLAILDAIAAQGYDTLRARPIVTKARKLQLLSGALLGKLGAAVSPGRRS